MTTQLTKEDFLHKIADYEVNPAKWEFKGDKPCIVDFYSESSGANKLIRPILNELANEYSGAIDIYFVNIRKEKDLTSAFGIRTVPSFLLCPMGKNPKLAKGFMSKDEFRKAIREVLLAGH